MTNKYLYSDEENDWLIKNFKNFTLRKCSEILGRSYGSVESRVKKLKLRETNSKHKKQELFSYKLKNIDERTAYVMGYLWADGSISSRQNYTVNLNVKHDDGENITPIMYAVADWNIFLKESCVCGGRNHSKMKCFYLSNKDIHRWFTEMDYMQKTGKSPDKILTRIPHNLQKYWWRGYFDGDGCIHINQGYFKICFASAYDQDWGFVERLFSSLKIDSKIYRNTLKNGRNSAIKIDKKESVFSFLNYIYSGLEFGLDRKLNVYKNNHIKLNMPELLKDDDINNSLKVVKRKTMKPRKKYKIININSNEILEIFNLNKFCIERGIKNSNLLKTFYGKKIRKHSCGFKILEIEPVI